jgi:hypothetical protein
MMRNFMTSRSLTWVTELDEGPDENDAMSFPEENIVMTVYGGWPLSGRHRVSGPSPRTQLTTVGDIGA